MINNIELTAIKNMQHSQSLINDDRQKQEGLAVASIARDDLSTLPDDDPFPRARMHRDRNAR